MKEKHDRELLVSTDWCFRLLFIYGCVRVCLCVDVLGWRREEGAGFPGAGGIGGSKPPHVGPEN